MLTNTVNGDLQQKAFSVTVEGVTEIDNWLEQIAAQWELSERTAFGARLCIAELAANVLEHGVARSPDDHIVVTIDRVGDGIEVEFLDTRGCFDPTAPQASTEDHANGGGRGLALLRAYAHDLTYVAEADRNRTTFKIPSADAWPAAGAAERHQMGPSPTPSP
jgi:anti-sigma regulatory factor (Ser/Thr protein kinase)